MRPLPFCLLACLALAAPAARPADAVFPVDARGALGAHGRADLDAAAGPVVIAQVLLQNMPPAEELKDPDPNDRCDPKLVLVVTNPGLQAASLELEATLEDGEGHALGRCTAGLGLRARPQVVNDLVELCGGARVKTAEWARLKAVRLVGRVTVGGAR